MSHPKDYHLVCQTSDIPAGEAKMFVVADKMIGVYHIDGQFYALANECPHAGASMAHGIIESDTVSCRIHHWKFSITSGEYLDEPNEDCNLPTYQVKVVGTDVLVEISQTTQRSQ